METATRFTPTELTEHHIRPMYENNYDDYLNERCSTFNSMVGTLDKNDSYNCSCCHNKGVVWTVRNDEIVEYLNP